MPDVPDVPDVPGRYIEAGGTRSYVEVHGAGEPLLLLHGGLETVEMLPDLTTALAERYRVVSPERRGHGRTADAPSRDGPPTYEALTYEAMAAETLAVMDALGIARADIVGYSDGANIAMLLGMHAAQRVRRLVLVSGNFHANGMTRAFRLGLRRATAERYEPALAEAHRRLSPDGPEHWPVVFERVRQLWLDAPTLSADELAAIEAPTLVLAGDRDLVTVEHTVALFRAIPGARLCIVPGGSHGLLTEQPELTSRVILEFLGAGS